MRTPEIRVIWSEQPTGIPYDGYSHDNGTNHGYVSLRADPSAIDRIPELNENLDLKALVESVNGPESALESVAVVEPYMSDQDPSGMICCLGLIYRDRVRFQCISAAAAFAPLFIRAAQKAGVKWSAFPLVELSPLMLFAEGLTGWRIELFLPGKAVPGADARLSLREIFRQVGPLLRTSPWLQFPS